MGLDARPESWVVTRDFRQWGMLGKVRGSELVSWDVTGSELSRCAGWWDAGLSVAIPGSGCGV